MLHQRNVFAKGKYCHATCGYITENYTPVVVAGRCCNNVF